MLRFLKRFFLPFFCSCLICTAICTLIIFGCLAPRGKVQKADNNYLSAPYSREIYSIMLLVSDLPVSFSVEIEPYSGLCRVFCFPKNCQNETSEYINESTTPEDIANFFSINYNKYIICNSSVLCDIINTIGGITISTVFPTPLPTNNGYLPLGENVQIFGSSVIGLIGEEKHPTSERMQHYSEIMGKVSQKVFAENHKKCFDLILQGKTNISYDAYYRFSKMLSSSFSCDLADSVKGYWDKEIYIIN